MFDHTTLHNPTASQNAANMAASNAPLHSAVTTNKSDRDAQTNAQLNQQRAIIDQIDLSIEANKRIEQSISAISRPVLDVPANPLAAFDALKPAYDDAQTRMNSEAFIVLSMMGIPPAKARAMANAMTDSAQEMTSAGSSKTSGAASAQELSISSRQIEINVTDIEARFSKIAGNANISISEFTAQIEIIRVEIAQAFQVDPLILDLDGNGIDVTSLEGGKQFDIDGNGSIDQTAWISGHDALLALDRNGDGKINDGRELFGDQHGAKDGFAELAKFDDNLDGLIDKQDGVFTSLVLLRADGRQQNLSEAGIKSISLSMITPLDQRLIGGDLVAESKFERDDGSIGQVGEVFFDVKA
ncbi:hypothetical protein [Thalassospira sp.]|uniref:hypothetical protein n=1 Tax=Thalassospira sp. TaxID=1912094 RepID=UPI0032F03540